MAKTVYRACAKKMRGYITELYVKVVNQFNEHFRVLSVDKVLLLNS